MSKGKATHLAENAVHRVLNGLEPENVTSLAFNVLTQSAKSCKSGPTSRTWADVDLFFMGRASKMLVQGSQRGITAMTQAALVATAVPGSRGGVIHDIVAGGATSEQAGWVGNNVVSVVLAHIFVNGITVDA